MSGLLCLLLILLVVGLYSINQCSQLGDRIEKISHDGDQTGRNLAQMNRSGGAMTGALLERFRHGPCHLSKGPRCRNGPAF
jgi:hypothetical protein